MKKLAIYVHFDPKGEVREYIFKCLQGLQEVVSDILFVVNGTISPDARKRLEKMNVEILVRENVGFDWSAWKAGIEYYGYDKLYSYDELLLTNNTFYGPIYPFAEMWSAMDKKECDFWGIVRHPEVNSLWIDNDPKSKMLSHIQSYWLVFKNKILRSPNFKSYWENITVHKSYQEMVGYGETKLTKYFEDCGFQSATYIDSEKYNKIFWGNISAFLPDSAIIDEKCPVLKRKPFFEDHQLAFNSGLTNKLEKALDYITHNTSYDENLIWSDLLKSQSMYKLHYNLNLNYTLSSTSNNYEKSKEKIALIMFIYPEEKIEYMYHYVKSAPEFVDIFVVTTKEEMVKKIEKLFNTLPNKVEYRVQQNRGRDNTALLVTCKDVAQNYDFIGFVHAKKSPHVNALFGRDFSEHCFTNLLYDENYVKNVIQLFKDNKHIGFLSPPPPHIGALNIMGDEWSCNYYNTRSFLKEKMKIDVNLDEVCLSAFGGMFWFRKEAFKTMLSYNWSFEDFPEEPLSAADGLLTHSIERFIPYLVQYDGYYPAWVMVDKYASMYVENLYFRLRNLHTAYQFSLNKKDKKILLDHYKLKYYYYKIMSKIVWSKKKKKKAYKSKMYFYKNL
ncbi:MAG: rhamnan synthesis F family protein [Alphaproteobacteria bacterium]|nr:rhamnan synthesis F family protein [Alphaproteobacteria bacterium]